MKVDRISELPEEIIQHIQSFLQIKEATRTILLSKVWLRAWSTRPFLDFFDLLSFINHSSCLIKLIDTTLESYLKRGIPIVKFRVYAPNIEKKWLKSVSQSNVIDLDLDLDLEEWYRGSTNASLWFEIFQTKSLQVLKVAFQESELVVSRTYIKCLKLKKLELRGVQMNYDTVHDIMCSCPLIEELLLVDSWKFRAANLEIIQSFNFEGGCKSLKRLSLIDTDINDEQLQMILSKSSKLEDLKVIGCDKLVKRIKLSSPSLRCVVWSKLQHNLQWMDYRSFHKIPFPFTIISPITKGMVNVTISYHNKEIDESWFHGLRQFLTNFAKSTVKVSRIDHFLRIHFQVLRATPLPRQHNVETLTIKDWFPCLTHLYGFFTVCHPKTLIFEGRNTISHDHTFLRILCKSLTYKGNLECCKFHQHKCWQHYIKDAKVYYGVDSEQKPLDMNEVETGLGDWIWAPITLALEWESFD